MKDINKIIGETISKHRKLKKVSQIELANYLNVTQSNISRFERGVTAVPSDTLFIICDYLDINLRQVQQLIYGVKDLEDSYKQLASQIVEQLKKKDIEL